MTTFEGQRNAVVPPRWLPFWLACLPGAFIASPVALLGWPYLRTLPRNVLLLLGFYALSQVLPALFTPEPLLALGGALLRTGLIFGLLGLGAAMGKAEALKPMGFGLMAVYLTALVFNFTGGLDLFVGRLSHPYMTPITLGLAGMYGLWLAIFAQGHWMWRWVLGLTGTAILMFSGSRGPLLAALAGLLLAFALHKRHQTILILVGVGLLGGLSLTLGERLGLNPLTRLTQTDTTGRDVVWSNTQSVIRAHPVAGVGSYRLGAKLTPPGEPCAFFEAPGDQQKPLTACPGWIARLGNPWLIAHNVTLQQLAETGPFGLLGLMVLLTAVTVVTLVRREPLAVATVTGLLLATVNDNTLLVPSPFFAEVFWLVAGTQLCCADRLRADWPSFGWKAGIASIGLTLTLSAPIWVSAVLPVPAESASKRQLHYFSAPPAVHARDDYSVYVQFLLPDGAYRAVLRSCTDHCVTLKTLQFHTQSGQSDLLTLNSRLVGKGEQLLSLQLLPGRATFQTIVLAQKVWKVQVKP